MFFWDFDAFCVDIFILYYFVLFCIVLLCSVFMLQYIADVFDPAGLAGP